MSPGVCGVACAAGRSAGPSASSGYLSGSMTAKLLVIQHDDDTELGALAPALARHGVASVIVKPDDVESASIEGMDGVLVLGGVMHPDNPARVLVLERELIAEAHEVGLPILGVCLGSQLVSQACGGTAGPASRTEIGWTPMTMCEASAKDGLLAGVSAPTLFEWHSYCCTPPEGAAILAENEVCIQAFRIGEQTWGIQFHVEVTPAIVAEWTVMGADDLASEGVDPATLVDAPAETFERSMAVADLMADRFGALVAARSARLAESPATA